MAFSFKTTTRAANALEASRRKWCPALAQKCQFSARSDVQLGFFGATDLAPQQARRARLMHQLPGKPAIASLATASARITSTESQTCLPAANLARQCKGPARAGQMDIPARRPSWLENDQTTNADLRLCQASGLTAAQSWPRRYPGAISVAGRAVRASKVCKTDQAIAS